MEPLAKPYAFSVARREVSLGIWQKTAEPVRHDRATTNGVIAHGGSVCESHDNAANKIAQERLSSSYMPVRPCEDGGKRPSRNDQRFYRARGYYVAPTEVSEALPLAQNTKILQKEEQSKASLKLTVARPATQTGATQPWRRQSQRRARPTRPQQYDVKPPQYILSDRPTKRRPATSYPVVSSSTNFAHEGSLTHIQAKEIISRLHRASIFVEWGTQSVLMKNVKTRPGTSTSRHSKPIVERVSNPPIRKTNLDALIDNQTGLPLSDINEKSAYVQEKSEAAPSNEIFIDKPMQHTKPGVLVGTNDEPKSKRLIVIPPKVGDIVSEINENSRNNEEIALVSEPNSPVPRLIVTLHEEPEDVVSPEFRVEAWDENLEDIVALKIREATPNINIDKCTVQKESMSDVFDELHLVPVVDQSSQPDTGAVDGTVHAEDENEGDSELEGENVNILKSNSDDVVGLSTDSSSDNVTIKEQNITGNQLEKEVQDNMPINEGADTSTPQEVKLPLQSAQEPNVQIEPEMISEIERVIEESEQRVIAAGGHTAFFSQSISENDADFSKVSETQVETAVYNLTDDHNEATINNVQKVVISPAIPKNECGNSSTYSLPLKKKIFPRPNFKHEEILSPRDAASSKGFSCAVYDEIEGIPCGESPSLPKQDPPRAKVCFENGLNAEVEGVIEEALCWYSIGYGTELDSIHQLNGPFEPATDTAFEEHGTTTNTFNHLQILDDTAYALRCLLRRGELYQKIGFFSQAQWDFAFAALLAPKMLVCEYHLAKVEMDMHELKSSLNTLDVTIHKKVGREHDQEFVSSLWTAQAEVYFRRSSPKEAIHSLEKAIDTDPSNWRAHLIRGSILANGSPNFPSQKEGAYQDYIKVLRLNPQNVESTEALVNLVIGNQILESKLMPAIMEITIAINKLVEMCAVGKEVSVEVHSEAWIEGAGWTSGAQMEVVKNADICLALCQRSRLYAIQGNIKYAKQDLDRAIELYPEHPQAYLFRGALTHPSNLIEEAKRLPQENICSDDSDDSDASDQRVSIREITAQAQSSIHDLGKSLEFFPENFDALVLRASIYLKEEMYLAAMHDLLEASRINPDETAVHLEIARVNLQHFHDYDAALKSAQQALFCSSHSDEALFLRAEAFLRKGDTTSALRDYEEMLERNSNDPWPYMYKAQCLASLKCGRLALHAYIKSLKLFPHSVETETRVGELQMILDDFMQAVKTLRQAVSEEDTIENSCLLGEALLGVGDMSGAIEVLQSVISRDPNSLRGYNTLGKCYLKMERYHDASECFENAVKLNPKDPVAYSHRGVCKTMVRFEELEKEAKEPRRTRPSSVGGGTVASGSFDKDHCVNSPVKKGKKGKKSRKNARKKRALKPTWCDIDDKTLASIHQVLVGLEDFNKSLTLNSLYVEARLNRAELYLLVNRDFKALDDLNTALKQEAKNLRALINRGVLHCNAGRSAAAIADFDRALAVNKSCTIAYFNRGVAYGNIGDYKQAIVDYTSALELTPDSIETLRNRGLLHLQDGQYKNALKDLNSVMDAVKDTYLEATHADLISAIGHCEFHANRLIPEAIHSFNLAIDENPGAIEAYVGRGNVYLRLALRDEPMPTHLQSSPKPGLEYGRSYGIENLGTAVGKKVASANIGGCRRRNNFRSSTEQMEQEANMQIAAMNSRSEGFRHWARLSQKDFSKALAINPKQVEARVNLGFLLFVQGKWKHALRFFDGALSLFPKHRKALEGRSLVHMAMNNGVLAFEDINNALKDSNDLSPVANILDLIRVRKAMGGDMNSWEDEERRNEEFTKEETRSRTLNNIKRECECLVSRAIIRLNCVGKSWEEGVVDACSDLLCAIQKGERYGIPCPSAYYNYGTILLRNNKIDHCIEVLSKCITTSVDPFYLAHTNRGVAYSILGHSKEALADFNTVLDAQPSNFHVLFNRAVLYKTTKNYEKALIDLNRAISYAPDDAQMYAERGRVAAVQNKAEAAMKDFAIAMALDDSVKL